MRWFFTIIKILVFVPLRIIYPFKVIGKKKLPKKTTYVTITNHLNARDAIMLGLYLPGFRYFLAKKELAKNRFVRFLLKMFGAVYIDREGLDLKGIKTSINCLKNAPLSIFPEGTRNKENEEVQEVKGGAAMIAVKAEVDIIPVMIHHRTKAFRRNYMLICDKVELPYGKADRFNTEAMNVCTKIISDNMNENKYFIDKLVADKSYRQYNKQIKKEYKEAKRAARKGDIA